MLNMTSYCSQSENLNLTLKDRFILEATDLSLCLQEIGKASSIIGTIISIGHTILASDPIATPTVALSMALSGSITWLCFHTLSEILELKARRILAQSQNSHESEIPLTPRLAGIRRLSS
jgi:hypothetical protein